MEFRIATLDDAAVLAGMNLHLIRDEGHSNPMGVPELTRRMAGWLEGEYQAILFQDDDETPIGYTLYRWESEWVYIRQFFVKTEHRRKGVGRAAVTWLMAHVWKDAPKLRLEVLSGNARAIAFYRSVGFVDYCVTMERRPPDPTFT